MTDASKTILSFLLVLSFLGLQSGLTQADEVSLETGSLMLMFDNSTGNFSVIDRRIGKEYIQPGFVTYDVSNVEKGDTHIDAELSSVYAAEGASGAWTLSRYNTGHFETAAMRAEILAYLDRHL